MEAIDLNFRYHFHQQEGSIGCQMFFDLDHLLNLSAAN